MWSKWRFGGCGQCDEIKKGLLVVVIEVKTTVSKVVVNVVKMAGLVVVANVMKMMVLRFWFMWSI